MSAPLPCENHETLEESVLMRCLFEKLAGDCLICPENEITNQLDRVWIELDAVDAVFIVQKSNQEADSVFVTGDVVATETKADALQI